MKIGFIGTGNMGSGMIKGIISSKFIPNNNIYIFDLNKDKTNFFVDKYNIKSLNSEIEVVEKCDIIILAIKPNIYKMVLEKIKNNLNQKKIILTIAAGFSIEKVENIVGKDKKIVRTMPNTPVQVLEGMTAVTFNENINKEDREIVYKFLDSFGKSMEIAEKLMHSFTGIAGSLPAYVYMFMEALADGGVLEGIPREKSYEIIAQTVKGSAKMLLETGKHPGVLKDEVTSPGGTTIEAVKALEKGNFRGTVMEAVSACTEKSRKMSEDN